MATSRVLTVEVYVLDEYAEPGAWCDRCLLPSAFTMPYRIIVPGTLTTVGRGTLTACGDCGGYRHGS